jgi:hypothetical protein
VTALELGSVLWLVTREAYVKGKGEMPCSDFQAALPCGVAISPREGGREGGTEGQWDRGREGERRTKRVYLSDVIVARGGGGPRE